MFSQRQRICFLPMQTIFFPFFFVNYMKFIQKYSIILSNWDIQFTIVFFVHTWYSHTYIEGKSIWLMRIFIRDYWRKFRVYFAVSNLKWCIFLKLFFSWTCSAIAVFWFKNTWYEVICHFIDRWYLSNFQFRTWQNRHKSANANALGTSCLFGYESLPVVREKECYHNLWNCVCLWSCLKNCILVDVGAAKFYTIVPVKLKCMLTQNNI